MEVLARTLLVLLVATTAALSAPSAGPQGRWRESGEHGELHDALQPPLSRVARQVPGSDILTRLSEAFREKMHQKSEGVMDAVDQVGKALGTIGDTVHQAISDGLTAGALADGGERSSAGQVGQVLSSIGDTLHKVVSGGGQGDGQRSTGPQVDAASEPGADAPLGHILTSIGDKLRKVADGGEDGQRALGEVGQQVGKVLTSVGDTIRDVIRERQEEGDDDDDDEVARLVADPGDNGEKVPCNNGMGMMNQMNATMMNTNARRRRGRGRRAAA